MMGHNRTFNSSLKLRKLGKGLTCPPKTSPTEM